MTSAVSPTVYSVTWPITATSVAWAIPLEHYTHVLLCSNKNMWIKPGDSTVVVVPEALGCVYVPADTFIEVPTRRLQVEGITHVAVMKAGMGFDGFVNMNFGHSVYLDTDLLVNIHDCLTHFLHIHQGDPSHPHYPPQHEILVDVT